jgi:hypothetical protein
LFPAERSHAAPPTQCNLISTLVSCNCELAPLRKLPPPPAVKWIWRNIAPKAVGRGIARTPDSFPRNYVAADIPDGFLWRLLKFWSGKRLVRFHSAEAADSLGNSVYVFFCCVVWCLNQLLEKRAKNVFTLKFNLLLDICMGVLKYFVNPKQNR